MALAPVLLCMSQVAEENAASAEVEKNVDIVEEPEEPAVSELEA